MSLPNVIGLHGVARSGKDTIAQMLAPFGYQRLAFADALRDGLYAINPIVGADTKGRLWRVRDVVDEVGWDEAKAVRLHTDEEPEIRRLLQVIGTEFGREIISDTVWVDIVVNQIAEGLDVVPDARFVITDVRFPNEVKGLRDILQPSEVSLWKVTRDGVGSINSHVSDAGLDDDLFDIKIANDGDLDDLAYVVGVAIRASEVTV